MNEHQNEKVKRMADSIDKELNEKGNGIADKIDKEMNSIQAGLYKLIEDAEFISMAERRS